MVEYLTSEELAVRTFELCETCEKESKPGEHLCAAKRLDDPHVERVFRAADRWSGKRALTAIRRGRAYEYTLITLSHLPKLVTVGDLCAWSKWDLRKLDGVNRVTAGIAQRALQIGGVSLRNVSQQQAAADRRRAAREARESK